MLLRPSFSSALIARTVRENQAARRILEAAGFREKGLERQDGGLPSLVRYELVARQATGSETE